MENKSGDLSVDTDKSKVPVGPERVHSLSFILFGLFVSSFQPFPSLPESVKASVSVFVCVCVFVCV